MAHMKQSHVHYHFSFLEQLAQMRYGNVRLRILMTGGVSPFLTIANKGKWLTYFVDFP